MSRHTREDEMRRREEETKAADERARRSAHGLDPNLRGGPGGPATEASELVTL